MFVIVAVLITILAGGWFRPQEEHFAVYPSPYLTHRLLLSRYNPALLGTPGDTEVFIYEGTQPGGTLFVLGGSHPDEPAGLTAALVFAENARAVQGRLIVIPFANRSAFSHNLPQEGHPTGYSLKTAGGERQLKFGSRLTNPIHQWPDPTICVQQVDGQKLAGTEARNLNRAYPGQPDGSLTAQIAFGIMQLLKKEAVDVAIDMHESSPEYPVNNAIVAHERALEMAVMASLDLSAMGVEIGIEPSPLGLRGLSHREWGDNTGAYAFLLESANASQGRLRGKTDALLVTTGIDPMYVKAFKRGRLFVNFPAAGIPLSERTGRHVASVMAIVETFSQMHPERAIVLENIPTYREIMNEGVGSFLASPGS